MSIIRSIRGGSAGLNEEDMLTIAGLLIPGNTKGKKEYVIEYEEIEQKERTEK